MTRPRRQTVDYFPHFVTSGKTLFILETSYGNDGYAFWFKLLEILGSSEGHFYDCNNQSNWMFLLAKTKVNNEQAVEIVDKLTELEAIDRELWGQKIIWSQNLVSNLTEVYRKRGAKVPLKPHSRDENPTSALLIATDNPIGEERKGEESIGEERRGEEICISTAVIKSFNENIHPISPLEFEKINHWLEDMEPEVIIAAIEEAVNYNKRSMGYINSILNSWFTTGIKTKEALESHKRDRADEKNSKKPPSNPKNPKKDSERQYTPEEVKEMEQTLLGRKNQ